MAAPTSRIPPPRSLMVRLSSEAISAPPVDHHRDQRGKAALAALFESQEDIAHFDPLGERTIYHGLINRHRMLCGRYGHDVWPPHDFLDLVLEDWRQGLEKNGRADAAEYADDMADLYQELIEHLENYPPEVLQ